MAQSKWYYNKKLFIFISNGSGSHLAWRHAKNLFKQSVKESLVGEAAFLHDFGDRQVCS